MKLKISKDSNEELYYYTLKDMYSVFPSILATRWMFGEYIEIKEFLSRFVKGYMKNVHINIKKRVDRLIEDCIESYIALLLSDIIRTGKIYDLPCRYGFITLIRYLDFKSGKYHARFVIIHYPSTERYLGKDRFTKVHIKDIQLWRETFIAVNENPKMYHTMESFEDEVKENNLRMELLINI